MAQLRNLYFALRFCFGLGQPISHTRIGTAGVQYRFHRGHFFTPLGGGIARHHGFLIPAQTASHLPQGLRFALERHQIIIGCHVFIPLRIEQADNAPNSAPAKLRPTTEPP